MDKDKTNKELFSLADYSHEIRNPLNGMTGLLEIISDTHLTSEQRSLIENIQDKNSQLQLILNQIFELSKLKSGNLKNYPEQILIFPFLQKILDELFSLFRKERIKLCFFLSPKISGIVLLDPILIKQIIIEAGKQIIHDKKSTQCNLEIKIENDDLIFDYKYSGDIIEPKQESNYINKVRISQILTEGLLNCIGGSMTYSKSSSNLLLSIPIKSTPLLENKKAKITKELLSDKKMLFYNSVNEKCDAITKHLEYWGMKVNKMNDLFSTNKWNNSYENEYHIIGIDLSNEKINEFQIIDEVRKHSLLPIILFKEADNTSQKVLTLQKDIVLLYKPVSSQDFSFILEAVIQSNVNILREWLRNPSSYISEYKDHFKILVVEDEPINRRVMSEYFTKLHLKIDIASSGEQAIELYEQHFYDLIFMDINMPGIDGVQTTQKIREINEDSHPYIIAITADALKGDKKAYKEAGMDDYLFKPVNIDSIQKKISKYIQLIRH